MHDSAYRLGELVMRTYSDLPNASILEIGSLNVNGCLRDAAAPTTNYVGLDLEKGPSVDKVIKKHGVFPVKEETFDLVMASSVFEHDPRFWDTFLSMCRAAKAGGHIYINAPSNGTIHRYPMDCWRFYPDAGLALADHARAAGLEIDLVESFVARRHSDVWNDFVAIFRRGPSAAPMNTAFVYYRYPAMNARTWQSGVVYEGCDASEDMTIISDLRAELASPRVEIDTLRKELEDAQSKIRVIDEEAAQARDGHAAEVHHLAQAHKAAEARAHLAEQAGKTLRDEHAHISNRVVAIENDLSAKEKSYLESVSEVLRLKTALDTAQEAEAKTREELTRVTDLSTTLESNLRQRQEEAQQAWTEAAKSGAERDQARASEDELRVVARRLEERLAKADAWVFQLAGERRLLEQRLFAKEVEMRDAHRAEERAKQAAAERSRRSRLKDIAANRHIVEERIALYNDIEALLEIVAAQDKNVQVLHDQLSNMRVIFESVRANLATLRSETNDTQEKLVFLLTERERELAERDERLAWLHRLHEILPIVASDDLRQNGLFDGEAYLRQYSDVANNGWDPLRHYLLYGINEARQPNPDI